LANEAAVCPATPPPNITTIAMPILSIGFLNDLFYANDD